MPIPSRFRSTFAALVLAALFAAAPTAALALQGDCSQPVSNGANPTASDCLFILKSATGSETCDPACVCNTNGDANITATDALVCLKKAVGQNVTLACPEPCEGTTTTTIPTVCETNTPIGCAAPLNTCTSGRFVSVVGSDLDTGWNGLAHNQDLVEGAEITVGLVRRCEAAPDTICIVDSDCPSGECRPFCDCDNPDNSICEITGPTHQARCVRDLAECDTNADCGAGGRCERFFGPPLPLSAANTPACITTFFEDDITGTADSETGEGRATAFLRSRVHLGVTNDKPCPRCGAPNQNPVIGDSFNCDGGPNNGNACVVEAVSPDFGGVSSACPPAITSSISGEGLAIRFLEVTTGTSARTAELPCLASGFCTDDSSECTSNADCSGLPVTCGFYCHCGFCDNDPAQPCFNSDECDEGETCDVGNSTTGQQDQPNACTDLTCGRVTDQECCNSDLDGAECAENISTPLEGTCTTKKFISCSGNSSDPRFGACERENAGTCQLDRRSCFEHEITRTGVPSPLGDYCVDDPEAGACTTNADCATGACVADTSEPTTVALFCVPKTASAAINAAGGIPGPGAITFKSVIFACRCGDGEIGCDEQCDDNNNVNGDGCDQACRTEAP